MNAVNERNKAVRKLIGYLFCITNAISHNL